MKIDLSPMRMDTPLTLHRAGDVLTVNAEAFDFSPLPEGAVLPRDAIQSPWFAGDVTRVGGILHLSLILPHGANAPEEARFPSTLVLTGDGLVALPDYDTPTEGPTNEH
jgi:hypothetical protein